MKEQISILLDYIPRYGEILLGVGSIALSYEDELIENLVAKEDLKQYLLNDAPKEKNILRVSKAADFQRLIYNYTGEMVNMIICKDSQDKGKTANIFLVDFFRKAIWPVLVNKYIDTIYYGIDRVIISVNIKKNVYVTIYNEDKSDLFFKEFKEFLLYNHIVICEAITKENGDIQVKLMLPVPPNMRFNF